MDGPVEQARNAAPAPRTATVQSTLQNETAFRSRIERPKGTHNLGKGVLTAIDGDIAAAIGVKHLFGNRAEGIAEVIGRFDDDDAFLRRIDSHIGEQLAPEGLIAVGVQYDLDARDA